MVVSYARRTYMSMEFFTKKKRQKEEKKETKNIYFYFNGAGSF